MKAVQNTRINILLDFVVASEHSKGNSDYVFFDKKGGD